HQLEAQVEIAQKFARQLSAILEDTGSPSFETLYERTGAASDYFIKFFNQNLLTQLNEQVVHYSKLKRTKSYLAELQNIKLIAERIVKQMANVKEITHAMTKKSELTELLQLAGEMQKPVPVKTEQIIIPKQKREKGSTQKLSLEMYLKRQTIKEIAGERNLANSTIESHLVSFILTGEVNVYDFVQEQKLDAITDLLKKDPEQTLTSAKQILGDDFSYAEIKAGFKFYQKENQIIPSAR